MGTLRAATRCAPGELRGLHLAQSSDLICKNLMCGKVGTPCVCRLGRWISQNRALLDHCEQLSLRGNALHGLPGEIWTAMPRLTHLDLSQNDLRALPDEVSGLANLEVLFLNSNKLRSLPQSLWSMPRLRYVNISANNISSEDWRDWASALGQAGGGTPPPPTTTTTLLDRG